MTLLANDLGISLLLQGMGVYLYGELMLSGSRALIKLAHTSFQQLQHNMSGDNFTTVHAMLFGDWWSGDNYTAVQAMLFGDWYTDIMAFSKRNESVE